MRTQRGAALLMAMIIVTLITTLAAAMVWQQWRAVQVESAERAREESAWVLGGALDWARLILRENLRASPAVDHLRQPWATPLAEARLSTFLAADKDNTDDGPEAFLSGTITDAQGRYNLTNLVASDKSALHDQTVILQHLCESIGLSGQVAVVIANGMSAASATTPNGGAPLLPTTVDQLSWFGLDRDTIAALTPFVIVLPLQAGVTSINVNTAPREVLAAVAGLDLGTAERLHLQAPFLTLAAFTGSVQGPLPQESIGISSSYFEVRGRLRLEDHVLEQRTLVWRQTTGLVSVVNTDRVSSNDPLRP